MHYKDGREAKEGESVIWAPTGWTPPLVTGGKVHSFVPGSQTCNATLAEPIMGGVNQRTCINLGDCIHLEDALAAFNAQQAAQTAAQSASGAPAAAQTDQATS